MTERVILEPTQEVIEYFRNLQLGKEPTFCRICHRILTDPNSIQAGIGPECAQKGEEE